MINLDERSLWWSEQDKLARVLSNKTPDEINELLEMYNYIFVLKYNKVTPLQRIVKVLTLTLIPFLLLTGCVKWVLTGDRFLDGWLQKIGFREWAKKWMF